MKNVNTLKPHVSLNVSNVENSIAFYKKLFGIEPVKVRTDYAKFDVQNPPLNLALNELSSARRGSLSHLGVQVASTEDVLAIKAQWEERGLLTKDEMQTNCCYALQDKTWVSDPDGNEWEVFVVLEDDLAEVAMCCVQNSLPEKSAEPATKANVSASCCPPSPVPIGVNRSIEKSCC